MIIIHNELVWQLNALQRASYHTNVMVSQLRLSLCLGLVAMGLGLGLECVGLGLGLEALSIESKSSYSALTVSIGSI